MKDSFILNILQHKIILMANYYKDTRRFFRPIERCRILNEEQCSDYYKLDEPVQQKKSFISSKRPNGPAPPYSCHKIWNGQNCVGYCKYEHIYPPKNVDVDVDVIVSPNSCNQKLNRQSDDDDDEIKEAIKRGEAMAKLANDEIPLRLNAVDEDNESY